MSDTVLNTLSFDGSNDTDVSAGTRPKVVYHPIINGLQKIALYETRTMYYLIGSNATQSRFRVLKIDRTEPEKLLITDDKVLYSLSDIRRMLSTLNEGNKGESIPGTKLSRAISAFGIVGFVRFLQGYYLILVTKRRKVASVGLHSIYKIEDTSIRSIPHESCRSSRGTWEEEQRYLKLFLNVDLKANFYFSYSYDLTHTLQYNLAPPAGTIRLVTAEELECFLPDGRYKLPSSGKSEQHMGYMATPDERYVWNSYLLDVAPDLHPAWKLSITHGFIEQVNMSVFGHSYYLTLIARRSRMFAGTRFLKRGTNFQGDVANEVETEQIVFDSAMADLPDGRFTSFVQLRGSIPVHWTQDVTKMVPKPPISIQLHDPLASSAGHHFNRLLKRHGSPILILDLTKRRESRMHESCLGPYFKQQLDQLNLTMLPCFRLDYRRLDMAYLNKLPRDNAMNHLSLFSSWALRKTGIYCTPATLRDGNNGDPVYQTGTVRVNCVDCLDRTNTAQYALGKCALAHQLHLLGVLETPLIPWDSDCSRVLEDLFEDHGDTMALQYGGSHLVHRIQTYRHTAKWSSHTSDMMQSLSRYYSNTFSDLEKQQSINVFLGFYVPHRENVPLFELNNNDFYLHNIRPRGQTPCHREDCAQWWDRELAACLPLPLDLRTKTTTLVAPVRRNMISCIDLYNDFYRPSEMTVMGDHFQQTITSTLKAYLASNSLNPSPFCPRVSANKQRQKQEPRRQNNTSFAYAISQTITQTLGTATGMSTADGCDAVASSSDSTDTGSIRTSLLAHSNSSSDGEGTDPSEELGIWPPLDSHTCWMPQELSDSSPRLPVACPASASTLLTPALFAQINRPVSHSNTVETRGNRKLKVLPVPWSGLAQEKDTSRQAEPFIASMVEFDERQEMLYCQQQQWHLRRQFAFIEDTHQQQLQNTKPVINLAERLFPDSRATYGSLYNNPTKKHLRLFARYARMAQQTSPLADGTHEYIHSFNGLETSSNAINTSSTQVKGGGSTVGLTCCSWVSSLNTKPRSAEPLLLVQESTLKQDSYLEMDEPSVALTTRNFYHQYVERAEKGASEPYQRDLHLYERYASFNITTATARS
uniref:Polyphosphoinositide phosphatase-like n=2 Tax=Hirondellea gigas TaxID=1518452 RepID=A0A2P2I588_9CRUS